MDDDLLSGSWGSHLVRVILLLFYGVCLSSFEGLNLTEQETRVAQVVLFGFKTDSMSKLMGIKQSTIQFHITNILRKARCDSRAQFHKVSFKRFHQLTTKDFKRTMYAQYTKREGKIRKDMALAATLRILFDAFGNG